MASLTLVPPNNALQLTGQSVTPFACEKAAPIWPAAELGRYAAVSGRT
jgi:4'-phosphopantetheinyl transferase EntD